MGWGSWATRWSRSRAPAAGAEDGAGLEARGQGEAVVDLLQAYDELFLSYSDSRRAALASGVDMGERPGEPIHAIAVDGRGAGRWRWAVGPNGVAIEARWRRAPTSPERGALVRAVAAVSDYWERQAGFA